MTCLKNQPPVVTMKRPVVEYARVKPLVTAMCVGMTDEYIHA